MSKASKIWLIVAAALVLVGILAFVGVMALRHWNFNALSSTKFETTTFEITDAFESINIRSDTAAISLEPSTDGACKVVFYVQDDRKTSAAVQSGTLTVEETQTGNWYDHITLFSAETPKITVYLPQEEYASLIIDEDTGAVVIPKDFSFDSIDISADTGAVECLASAAERLQIETDTGNIHVENISAGELWLSVSTGLVEARAIDCAGRVDVTVSTGRARLTDVRCQSLSSKGSTGALIMENVIAEEGITVKRSTGDVTLERCDAGELNIQTATGAVTGTLLTEKIFFAESDTGHVEVPKTTSGGTCTITTDTGDIRIEIAPH